MNIFQVLHHKIRQCVNGIIVINCLLVSAVGTAGEITDSSVIEILEGSPLFELPEWSESFELAEIRNSSLLDFLKEKIIPYFDRAGSKGENRLYLEFNGNHDDNGEEVIIIAKSNCETCSATEFRFNNPEEYNKTYVTIISEVVVFLVDLNNRYEPTQLIKPLGESYRPNPKYWRAPMSIHDEEGIWLVHATDNGIVLKWFAKGEGEVFREWRND